MIRPLGASAIRNQTVDWTAPHDGRGSFISFVAPTVVPLIVAGGWTGTAFARLSFGGGGSGSAAAVGPTNTTNVATTSAARNIRTTLHRCRNRLKTRSRPRRHRPRPAGQRMVRKGLGMCQPVARSTKMMAKRWSAELELVGAGGEPVDLRRTLVSHGVADLPPNRIDDESWTLELTVPLDGKRPRTVRVSAGRSGHASLDVLGRAPGKSDLELLRAKVAHVLRLDEDLTPFYEVAATDPD